MAEYRLTIADKTHPQSIPSKNWTELEFTDNAQGFSKETRFRLWDGRTIATTWVSSNLPTDPTVDTLVAAINAATNGTAAWQSAMEAGVKYALKREPPTWKFRVMRHVPNAPDDVTNRDVRYVADVTDWAASYVDEFGTDINETYSIEVWHNLPVPVILDARIIHLTRVVYDVR